MVSVRARMAFLRYGQIRFHRPLTTPTLGFTRWARMPMKSAEVEQAAARRGIAPS